MLVVSSCRLLSFVGFVGDVPLDSYYHCKSHVSVGVHRGMALVLEPGVNRPSRGHGAISHVLNK